MTEMMQALAAQREELSRKEQEVRNAQHRLKQKAVRDSIEPRHVATITQAHRAEWAQMPRAAWSPISPIFQIYDVCLCLISLKRRGSIMVAAGGHASAGVGGEAEAPRGADRAPGLQAPTAAREAQARAGPGQRAGTRLRGEEKISRWGGWEEADGSEGGVERGNVISLWRHNPMAGCGGLVRRVSRCWSG